MELLARAFWASLGPSAGPFPPEALNAASPSLVGGPAPADDLVQRLIRDAVPFSKARQLAALDFERRYVKSILESFSGNVTKAAQASGIGRRYLHMLLAKIDGRDEDR